jgi:H+/gluconate symporter-like permease
MTTLPGTPQLTNIIPSQFLGTPTTAAPVFRLIHCVVNVVLTLFYFSYAEKDARKKNETFALPPGYDQALLNTDKSKLPSAALAFTPIIVLILFIIISTIAKAPYAADSALLTTMAMLIAMILCIALNPKRVTVTSVKNWIGDGSANGIVAIVGLASVVAFGAVVSNAPAFQVVIKWVLGLNLNVYVKGVVSTAIVAGITGSSSGGVRITLQNLAESFIASGCNLQVLHRLVAVAAGSFDTLPHVSGIFLFLAIVGCTHKEGYKHVGWTTVVIPVIVCIVGLIPAMIIW